MQEDKHYVISFDKDKEEHVIAPVDYINSGVVQSKTNWEKGLHQFLQAKHKLRMQPEGLTTSFISNLSFFSMYGSNIMGMTGTLGSNDSRTLLAQQYNLDTVIIPKFKDDLFYEEEAIILGDSVLHKQAITDDAIAEANKGRAVLIICSDIGFTKACAESIVNAGYDSNKVNIYSRNDLDEESVVSEVRKPGDIIIATNLAGRGTDIRLEDQVNKAGGLYVIQTSLAKNLRVEDQAFGRTAREGNSGSGRLIIDGVFTSKSLGTEYNPKNDISVYKKIRDFIEKERLSSIKEKELAQVAFTDKLFNKFNKGVYQPLKKQDQNRYLLEQLEENWGFWLKRQEGNIKTTSGRGLIAKEFESFKSEQIKSYRSGQPTNNPIYQIQMAHSRLGKDNSYDESIDLLERIVKPDDPFSFAGHYYLAYAYLRKNLAGKAKNDMNLSTNPFKHLSIAKAHLEDVIIAQLQAMQLILGPDSMGTALGIQISNKIELLHHQLNYINNAIEFLENNIDGKRIVTAGTTKTFDQFYPPDQVPKGEIEELNRLGSLNLYTIDAKNPPKDIFSSVVVTLVGVGQVVFGVIATIATGGVKGVGLIVGGLQDVYRGASAALKGEGIDLGEYFKAKAIEIGIDLISTGIANKMRGPSNLATKELTAQAAKRTTKEVLIEVGIRVGIKLSTDQAVKVAVKELSKTTFKKAIGGEIKKAIATIKARLGRFEVKNALENIYALDSLYNNRYSSKLSSEVNSFLNKRSSELESIAASIISSTLSKATAGNGAAFVVINTASTGLQIGSEIDKIQDIADKFCDYMERAILEVAGELPGNSEIIRRMVPSLTQEDSQVAEENLKSAGIITGQWEIDEELLGFKQGIDEILKSLGSGSDIEVKSVVSGSDQGSSVIVPFEFEEIKKDTSIGQDDKSKEIERRDLDKMRLAIGLNYKKYQIKEAVRKMYSALARRGELAEPVIESYSEIVALRMRGQIKSAIVSPVLAKPIGEAFSAIEQSLVQSIVYNKHDKLEKEFLLENYKRAGLTLTGVSAGDGPEEKEPVENDKQNKTKPKTLDLSPDQVFLEDLASLFEMDQDSEIARMLKGLKGEDIVNQLEIAYLKKKSMA